MNRIISVIISILLLFSLSGCILKKSDLPCSTCGKEKAYLYKIERIGKRTLDEKITVSYCEHCYEAYLEETFGYGKRAQAEEDYAHFKDVVGSGGYIDDLKK